MSWRQPGSLATRLLVAQIIVSVAMALTMVAVASIAGPPLFEAHMHEAGHVLPEVLHHSAEAFAWAGLLSLSIGLAIAAAGAIVVSVLIARRLRIALADIGAAAERISGGDYAERVDEDDRSRELATLARGFNTMAGRLAAVEGTRRRLLTDLAHEIRTPLASMEICVESLEDGVIEPGPEAWEILKSQITRIARLSQDLDEVSAAEEGRLNLAIRPLNANALAESAAAAAREGFERKGVLLGVVPEPGATPTVAADPARIGQVLANLLSNAVRHTPPGGRVTLTVRREGGSVLMSVTDTGSGIAPEHLEHIFERFYRVDTARDRGHGGTGVGLAISQAIAKAHGGSLTVASAGEGSGASFVLALPAALATGAGFIESPST